MHANSCNTPKCELFDFDIWLLKSEFIVGHKDVAKNVGKLVARICSKIENNRPHHICPQGKNVFCGHLTICHSLWEQLISVQCVMSQIL